VNTGDEQRDQQLKSADFSIRSNIPVRISHPQRVQMKGAEEYSVTGDLTIHGTSRPLTVEVEGPSAPIKDPWGNTRVGLLRRPRSAAKTSV
jgi:polyisoprenoid-binding protein YceI